MRHAEIVDRGFIVPVFKENLLHPTMKMQVASPPKCSHISAKVDSVITQDIIILMLTTMRTLNLTVWLVFTCCPLAWGLIASVPYCDLKTSCDKIPRVTYSQTLIHHHSLWQYVEGDIKLKQVWQGIYVHRLSRALHYLIEHHLRALSHSVKSGVDCTSTQEIKL